MMMEKHSHKKFWLAIVILAIVAITFFGATGWVWHELNERQNTLLLVEGELGTVQTQWADAKTELATVEAGLTTVEAELATVEIELTTSKELVESLEATLSNLQVDYGRLTRGYDYVLRDPSYQEMREFLARDKTDEREWVEGEYTILNFAADVKLNAVREGIRCAYVYIGFPEGMWPIIAFDTTDRGLVFIESDTDWKVEPQIGQRYYQCRRPPPGYAVARPDWDDTITEIIIMW
jgi:ribonuclease HI